MGPASVLTAFGLGLLAGAVVTLLTTPESGTSVRTRLKRGAEAAKRELGGIAGETRESWDRVRDDTEEAVKRTATRIKEAARVTKEALAEGGNSVPKVP
jgi:gas vesicle protein